jgi:hypothetical protein
LGGSAIILLAAHFLSAPLSLAACQPSDITEAEARILALDAAEMVVTPPGRHHLAAEPTADWEESNAWLFRVRVTNNSIPWTSSLVGWFAVNKRTTALTDPVVNPDAPVPYDLPSLAPEQAQLRMAHCLG